MLKPKKRILLNMYVWTKGPQNSYSLMIFEYLNQQIFFFLPTGPNLESNDFLGGKVRVPALMWEKKEKRNDRRNALDK